jgi:hypothetical protein
VRGDGTTFGAPASGAWIEATAVDGCAGCSWGFGCSAAGAGLGAGAMAAVDGLGAGATAAGAGTGAGAGAGKTGCCVTAVLFETALDGLDMLMLPSVT